MISDFNQTPKGIRIHIGVFGDTNAGKSTFINAVTGHETALTSPIAGTTTDPVFKPMELLPLGPVVFIDTAGLDDKSELGNIRIKKTMEQLALCDAAVLVINSCCDNIMRQQKYIAEISAKKIPLLIVINEIDGLKSDLYFDKQKTKVVSANIESKSGIDKVKQALIEIIPTAESEPSLTGNLVNEGDFVLLVAPQNVQAPKGRLILPEVQVTRDLLDNNCVVITAALDNITSVMEKFKCKPALVVTDSQIFKEVNAIIPEDIPLTSFSVLMAKVKGDILGFIRGAEKIDELCDGDKVLIMESCSHHAMKDDIARVKIPSLLRKYTGKNIDVQIVSGQQFNLNFSEYKLAIHCGGCMINRKAMLEKQRILKSKGVPVTNFGIAIAYMNKILGRVCF